MLLNCGVEKTLESPLSWKEIKPVNPKGSQSWIFIGRTDAEAEAPILCPPDVKNWLIGKGPDAGKDWGPEENGQQRTKWLDGINQPDRQECEQAPGDGEGKGSLTCCNPWGLKDSDRTELLTANGNFFFFPKGCSSWYTCNLWKCSLLLSR